MSRLHACISTCRDCGGNVFNDAGVRYAKRHTVCADCAIKRGAPFLATLQQQQLEALPAMPLKKAGLFDVVTELIEERKAGAPPAAPWPKWLERARTQALIYGVRRVPLDWWREYFAQGHTPKAAVDQILIRRSSLTETLHG